MKNSKKISVVLMTIIISLIIGFLAYYLGTKNVQKKDGNQKTNQDNSIIIPTQNNDTNNENNYTDSNPPLNISNPVESNSPQIISIPKIEQQAATIIPIPKKQTTITTKMNKYISNNELFINNKKTFSYGMWFGENSNSLRHNYPSNTEYFYMNQPSFYPKITTFIDLFTKNFSSDIKTQINNEKKLTNFSSNTQLGYFIADEPGWSDYPNNDGFPLSEVNKRYDFLDKYDNKPLRWINFACADILHFRKPDLPGELKHYTDNIKLYSSRADIVSLDYYPNAIKMPPNYRVINNPTISGVGDYIDIYRDTFNNTNKVIWLIAQGFSVKNSDENNNKIELRYMPYQAIIHGAKGIIFYGFHYENYPSFNFYGTEIDRAARPDIIYPILKELEENQNFIASNPIIRVIPKMNAEYDIIPPFDGIEYAVYRENDEILIILANRYDKSVNKTFNISKDFGLQESSLSELYQMKYKYPNNNNYRSPNNLIKEKTPILSTSSGQTEKKTIDLVFNPYQVYLLKGKIN